MLKVALFSVFRLAGTTKKKWRDYGLTLLATPKENDAPDVLIVPLDGSADVEALPGLRRRFPHTLIVAAITSKKPHPGVFAHPAIDDFMTLASLKQEISLHVARWERLLANQRELEALREEVSQLSDNSKRLLQQLERDLGMATEVQRALFPKETPLVPGINVSAKYLPAAGIGGDYYDIFEIEDRKQFGVLMADSKTHGMAAALLTVLLKTTIEQMKDRFPQTFEFIEFLNHELNHLPDSAKDLNERAEISVLYATLDRASLSLKFTSAGGLYPIVWRRGNLLETTRYKNPPLGNLDHHAFRETEVALEPGDRILFFTDGFLPVLEEPARQASEVLESIFEEADENGRDAIHFQNEVLARIHRYKEKHTLKDDLTFVLLSVDEKALFLRPAVFQSSK